MNKNIFKYGFSVAAMGLMMSAVMTSCTKEPDESNLYTFTGETIEDYITSRAELSAFNAILEKSGYARNMSTYGHYTCFAPVNEGVKEYLDSLYNDEECVKMKRAPHNGIQETPGFTDLDVMSQIQYLGDSIAMDIAKYHLANTIYRVTELDGSNVTWSTMLGRTIAVSVFDKGQYAGHASLNSKAAIVDADQQLSNGVVHVISNAMPHPALRIPEIMGRQSEYSIFSEALKATGWDELLLTETKGKTYSMGSGTYNDRDGNSLYYPKECKIMYTLFAETDEVFAKEGIEGPDAFNILVDKCKEWYGSCASWYPYLKGKTISTDKDYKNPLNVLNMFVAYHILKAGMPVDRIVYEYSGSNPNWNYSFGYEPQDYFETMLPCTLMKFWELNPKSSRELLINRYVTNNTLTDQKACFGSYEGDGTYTGEPCHRVIEPGIKVLRNKSLSSINGYIHQIDRVLKYDQNAQNAMIERLRFDTSTFLTELINNGIRGASPSEIGAMNGGGNGARCAFPLDFFDNIVCYNSGTVLRFCVQGAWRAHESDQMQGWGAYDFAVKLPHVPEDGQYEVRIFYPPMPRGGLMQFYIGTSSALQDMQAVGLPFDARADAMTDATIGWTLSTDEEDYGIATDQDMHNRGYMRGPASFSRGTYNTVQTKLEYRPDNPNYAASQMTGGTSTRTEQGYGTMMVRHIVTSMEMKQGQDYWFRIKNLITDDMELGWSFDFIEIVPVSKVVNNTKYTEDWY